MIHYLAARAVCADGKAAADDLAERGDVRTHVVKLLRAAACEAKASHHLIEDEKRAVPCRYLTHLLQVAFVRRDAAHVADDRLDDDGGNVRAVLNESLFELGCIVEGNCNGVLRDRCSNIGTVGQAERGDT